MQPNDNLTSSNVDSELPDQDSTTSTYPKPRSTQREHKIFFIAKIVFAICLCVSIVLLAYGSTRSVEDNSAFIYMGIGAAFVVISVGIAIYVYIKESKQNRK